MDRETVKAIVKNIISKDYERWISYSDECIKNRDAYTKSFYVWKESNGFIERDIESIVDIVTSY